MTKFFYMHQIIENQNWISLGRNLNHFHCIFSSCSICPILLLSLWSIDIGKNVTFNCFRPYKETWYTAITLLFGFQKSYLRSADSYNFFPVHGQFTHIFQFLTKNFFCDKSFVVNSLDTRYWSNSEQFGKSQQSTFYAPPAHYAPPHPN